MRFEVLHGNINEVYHDLPVENEEAPFRVRRFIGDAYGKIGFNADNPENNSLSGYTTAMLGKQYLFQMYAAEQTGTKLPSEYFHAFVTEAPPSSFAGDFSHMWREKFATQEEMLAASAGQVFHGGEEPPFSRVEVEIKPEVMKEIVYACFNRWSVNRNPVVILVPQEQPFQAYVKAVLGEVYSYLPAAVRAASGFVSAPRESYEPERGVALVFLPDLPKNAIKPNALRVNESAGYFATLFATELEPFVDYTLNLPREKRDEWLEEIFRQVEGNGDEERFKEVKSPDYAAYFTARIAWPQMKDREVVDLFAEKLKQPQGPEVYQQMEDLLLARFPEGDHDINKWALKEAQQATAPENIAELTEKLNQLGKRFPALNWKRETLLDAVAQMLLQQSGGDEYACFYAFEARQEQLEACFGTAAVQEVHEKLRQKKDVLVEQQYAVLADAMEKNPEESAMAECYPENRVRCRRRLAEVTNMLFHRTIKRFSGEDVEGLFADLQDKIDRCQDMTDEPAVQDMQACYDAYRGLWQAAQTEEAQNFPAYFSLITQIAQIPSEKLRPAILVKLRQWLNEVELIDYLNAYEQFCQEKPELTLRLRPALNNVIEEDFRVLSRHPLHMTVSGNTGVKALFDECNAYLGKLENCGLQDIRTEILLQFSSSMLIESYLLSVQELMAITQFILLNATSPLPSMPKEKLKELMLAFAAIGVFKSEHFETLLKISESRDYHRKLLKYCMEQSDGSLNEQVRLAEIYERCMGSIEAKRQLDQWYRSGKVSQELYLRLEELRANNETEEEMLKRKALELEALKESQRPKDQYDFDLKKTEEWEEPNSSRGFMIEIDHISREIQEEQAYAASRQGAAEGQSREETQAAPQPARRKRKWKIQGKRLTMSVIVLALLVIICVQIYKLVNH